MGVISSVGGLVDTIPHVRGWSVQSNGNPAPYHASSTRTGTGRTTGNIDWSGEYRAYGHTPAKMPGDQFTFTGSIDGNKCVQGLALAQEAEITIDIESGLPISHVVRFGAKGTLNRAYVADPDIADTVVPNFTSSVGCKIQTGPVGTQPPTFTEDADVRTITLTFTQDQPTYTSSGTAGVTQRVKANLDVRLQYGRYVDDFSLLVGENVVKQIRVFVNATDFYDLRWMRCEDATDMEVDIETGQPVSAVSVFGMDGFQLVSATPTVGLINKPGAVAYWPPA